MNKFYKTISLLFLGGCVLSACKKESKEEAVVFPLIFHSERLEMNSGVRVFTKDGEIKDPGKIANFVKYNDYFQIPDSTNSTKDSLFTFSSKNQVLISYGTRKTLFDLAKTNNMFLFTSTEETAFTRDPHPTKGLFKHINRSPIPAVELDLGRIMHVAYGDYKTLKLPMQRYFISRRNNDSNFSQAVGTVNNDIDESFISTLRNRDTLAYRTYHIVCSSK
ncbi:hypothetical protein [Pedobacter gandavensis]|uniref:hypothetical protein n=1 Tax=Pedobacter gandavensis TaxID=2679963 RepID=UPI0029319DBF|nr:hypothetical protein [Pedobacter gandavensis]